MSTVCVVRAEETRAGTHVGIKITMINARVCVMNAIMIAGIRRCWSSDWDNLISSLTLLHLSMISAVFVVLKIMIFIHLCVK